MSRVVTLPLAEAVEATPRSRLVTLDLSGDPYTFLAGQAVLAGQHGQPIRRPYSIACSPEWAVACHGLELLVGLEESGLPGPHLPTLTPGLLVDVQGPLGTFTFPEALAQRRLLFVAGGTGIAPLRSMLDHALRKHPAERVSFLYSARRADEFAFVEELRDHAGEGRIELHQTVTRDNEGWEGSRGRIGRSHFEAVLHDRLDTLCFVCGPPSLVAEAVTTLVDLGVPRAAIRTEEWATPNDERQK